MPLPYSETVMEHFRNPRNVGRIEDADAKSVEGSPESKTIDIEWDAPATLEKIKATLKEINYPAA